MRIFGMTLRQKNYSHKANASGGRNAAAMLRPYAKKKAKLIKRTIKKYR